MVIRHNISSINANRVLDNTSASIGKSAEKLSSGYRINRSADDAAGLSISEKMRKQIRGLQEGSVNSQNGISLVQIADSAMHEVHDMLQRTNELAIQAANGTMSSSDRQDCQNEVNQIINEIDAIRSRTYFNDIPVLKGVPVSVAGGLISPSETVLATIGNDLPSWLMSGIDSDSLNKGYMASTYTNSIYCTYSLDGVETDGYLTVPHSATYIDFSGANSSNISELNGKGFYSTCCTCNNRYSVKFDTNSAVNKSETSGSHYIYTVGLKGATSASDIIDRIMFATMDSTGELGNPNNHFTKYAAISNNSTLVIYDDRSSSSRDEVYSSLSTTGTITDVSVSTSDWQFQYYGITADEYSGTFGLGYSQYIDTNAVYKTNKIYNNADLNIHSGADADMENKIYFILPNISADTLGIDKLDLTVPNGPENAINQITYAIDYVSDERARMGAYQNRLEHTIKNLDNVVENSQAAESRIRDTDMAEEMVKYSKDNILQQAGQAMLAQANQATEGVLSLLQ